ncbi:hypothetical protein A9Q84_10980 [Halobacteriovorax marinus]|uniref:Uncharacterized protein n=1 Tax=Halobacteriovorax marinus TaxID=97084 RepID=A0A1Y5F7J8_9BACT|nr:hypothetical protein A9Q84_10980 [Halobacteriovorax marinus]
MGGKCYEVDRDTGGSNYSRITSARNCSSKKASYIWKQTGEIQGECYEHSGESYKVKVEKSKCAFGGILHHFLPRKSGWGGRCYAIAEDGGPAAYIESVKIEKCKPENTTFILNQARGNLQGECFEVDADSGRGSYSKSVKRDKCLAKKEARYSWRKDQSGLSGKCLEVKESTQGLAALKEVTYKKCIDFETTFTFKRVDRLSGLCLIIDKVSLGEVFSRVVSKRNCLKQAGVTENTLLQKKNGKYDCFQVDTKTEGNLFIDKAPSSDCMEKLSKPRWVSDETGWDGKCMAKIRVAEKIVEKSVSKSKCRPDDVFIMWHNLSKLNGQCYEVHGKYGSEQYAVIIEMRKCKPKNLKTIFYRAPKALSGNCYIVDVKTGGEKYNRLIGTRKCKEKLMTVPLK